MLKNLVDVCEQLKAVMVLLLQTQTADVENRASTEPQGTGGVDPEVADLKAAWEAKRAMEKVC